MKFSRRHRLVAFFLPLAGLLMVMPPMVQIFGQTETLFGVPSIIVFLFAVWFGVIGVAFLLQRKILLDQLQTTDPELASSLIAPPRETDGTKSNKTSDRNTQ